ncbi:hypothetical protein FRC12_013746 [Ceratobasidium sp. 428]|nr:hypothetical protein FRC12_013746 [Ceratobasidium sp. 428]
MRRHSLPTFQIELATLCVLWLLWLGGAAAAVTVWPDLSFCVEFIECRTLQATMGFAWLAWIATSALLAGGLWLGRGAGCGDLRRRAGWEGWKGRQEEGNIVEKVSEDEEKGVAL